MECQWCGREVLASETSTDAGEHEECSTVEHPHAAELLRGERTPRSWVDEVISGDADLLSALDSVCDECRGELLLAGDWTAEAEWAAA